MMDGNLGMPWIADLEFGGFAFQTDGDKTLDRDTNFGDANFLNGDHVDSDASLVDAYAGVSFRIIDTPLGWLSAGAVAHVLQGEVTMKSATDKDSLDDTVGVPAVTLRSAVTIIPTLTAGTGIQWMSLTVGDAEVDLIDVQAYVEWEPWRAIGFFAGYRFVDIKVEIDEDDDFSSVDANIGGAFLGVVISI
jgi:hypothetical protein